MEVQTFLKVTSLKSFQKLFPTGANNLIN